MFVAFLKWNAAQTGFSISHVTSTPLNTARSRDPSIVCEHSLESVIVESRSPLHSAPHFARVTGRHVAQHSSSHTHILAAASVFRAASGFGRSRACRSGRRYVPCVWTLCLATIPALFLSTRLRLASSLRIARSDSTCPATPRVLRVRAYSISGVITPRAHGPCVARRMLRPQRPRARVISRLHGLHRRTLCPALDRDFS